MGIKIYLVLMSLVIVGLLGTLGWVLYTRFIAPEPIIVALQEYNQKLNPDSHYSYYYEPTPGVRYETLGVFNTINSDTLNEEIEYAVQKPDGVFRIIALGDSATFGFGVARENNFSELLEQRFAEPVSNCTAKIEVINLGVPGFDIAYMVERFRLRGAKYNPDLILWNITGGDFTVQEEHRRSLLQQLHDTRDPHTAAKESFVQMNKELTQEEIVTYQIQLMKNVRQKYTKKIVITAVRGLRTEYKDAMQKALPNVMILDTRHPLLNDTEVFSDGHSNERGHKKMADVFYDYLISNNVVPCAPA